MHALKSWRPNCISGCRLLLIDLVSFFYWDSRKNLQLHMDTPYGSESNLLWYFGLIVFCLVNSRMGQAKEGNQWQGFQNLLALVQKWQAASSVQVVVRQHLCWGGGLLS